MPPCICNPASGDPAMYGSRQETGTSTAKGTTSSRTIVRFKSRVEREGAERSTMTAADVSSSTTGSQRSERRKAPCPASAPSFYCPLTQAVMKDPVQDREGNSYEKDAIEKWVSENPTSPITRNRLRRKHLVPNRALKEAIDFELKRQKEMHARKPKSNLLPSPSKGIASDLADDKSASVRSTKHSANINHHQVINNVLSSLNVKSQLDKFGIAFLPLEKLQPTTSKGRKMQILMVIEAPPAKETFQLYTHFNGSIEKCRIAQLSEEQTKGTSNENTVLNNLLQHGKYKALTLRKICDERMRFSFEGKKLEISSEAKVKSILDMFVKVSVRMKKRIEGSC